MTVEKGDLPELSLARKLYELLTGGGSKEDIEKTGRELTLTIQSDKMCGTIPDDDA